MRIEVEAPLFDPSYLAEDGIFGEVPPDYVPGTRTVPVTGLRSPSMFRRLIGRVSPVRDIVDKLHTEGKHVGATWRAGEVVLFVAKHRKSIAITGSIVGGVALCTAGAIYLIRRSSRVAKR